MKGNSYVPFMLKRGDGRTLDLDFTTGVLDSRITFSRASTATFINSSGLVQYAAHNLFTNTAWLGSTTPTNWNLLIGTGTTTWNANGSVTMTAATSQRPAINHATITTLVPNILHTFGFLATGVSGSPQINQIISSNLTETYAINGVTVAGSTVVQSGDLVSCTFTPTSTNATLRIGPGVSGNVSNTSVTASRPQFNAGSSLQTYSVNTTTSGPYQAPRFDCDPTTLAPRGLLIEGASTNLLNWSDSFATSGGTNNNWADTNITRNSTNNTDPANGTSALRVTASAGNGTIISTAAMGTSAQRTLSIWLRRVSGTGNIEYTLDNGSTYTTQAITSSWVRYTFAATTAAQRVGIRIVTSGDSIELWGAMLETSSGASSYIPTGSAQATRAVDTAIIAAGSNFTSWYQGGTKGTFYVDWFGGQRPGASGSTNRTALSTDDVSTKHLHMVQTAAAGNLRVADFGGTNNVTTSNALTSGASTKGAFSYNGSTANVCLNGGAVATGSSLAFSATPTWLVIGATSTNGTSITDANVVLNNSVRAIVYWPSELPNATLQSLTT